MAAVSKAEITPINRFVRYGRLICGLLLRASVMPDTGTGLGALCGDS